MDLWFVVIAALLLYFVYLSVAKARMGRCTSTQDMAGKTVIVTGSSRGIGYYVARDLAARNAKVIMANRPCQQSTNAVKLIQQATGNSNVRHKDIDLSSFESVRKFVAEIIKEENKVDVLVNNAGIITLTLGRTKDGLEKNMATNYFGTFLLTNLLLDQLKQSAPSRVIVTTSVAHSMGSLDFDNLNCEKYFPSHSLYGTTKLALILFTREMSRKLQGTGVTINCLHPGSTNTELFNDTPWYVRVPLVGVSNLFFRTPEDGAQTTIHLAVSEKVEGVSGEYFSECKVDQPSPKAQDDAVAKKLWEVTETFVGLK